MDLFQHIINYTNILFWDYFLIYLLLFCGIFFTFSLKFIQVRKLSLSIFKNDTKSNNGISPFSALMTSISAQVGTGNIAGVSLAIVCGGPGAIFWMWVSAFFGMATIFAEATLAQKFKKITPNGVTGGPAYYIQNALGKGVSKLFAFTAILGLGIIGCIVQSNSIALSFSTAFNLNPLSIGIILALLSSIVFLGGIKRLSSVTEKLVPIMAIFYIIGALVVIFTNRHNIFPSFIDILTLAFKPVSIAGGAVGISVKSAVRHGICRGLFSNEAGMGSTPHAHALASASHPAKQGLVAIFGVFIDTFIILNLTAFVILTTFENFSALLSTNLTGVALAQYAFSQVLGSFGSYFIAICMFFFGFSSILGLYLFGEINFKYIFGTKHINRYTFTIIFSIILGSVLNISLVWNLVDLLNGFLVIPNVISLLILAPIVIKLAKNT